MDLFANYFQWTVTAGGATTPVAGTSESFTVSSSTGAPAASNTATPATVFRIVDAADTNKPPEVMTVTNVSGVTWTVTRGAEGAAPWSHAANWTAVPVVTAGSMGSVSQLQLISRQVLGVAAATVTFSSIPQTYENLILEGIVVCSDAAGNAALNMRCNGDSAANYGNESYYGPGGSASMTAFAQSVQTSALVGYVASAGSGASLCSAFHIRIPAYARTNFFKSWEATTTGLLGIGNFAMRSDGIWSSTAAITSVSLIDGNGGNIAANSVLSLYGES